jgi:hypothetical protein
MKYLHFAIIAFLAFSCIGREESPPYYGMITYQDVKYPISRVVVVTDQLPANVALSITAFADFGDSTGFIGLNMPRIPAIGTSVTDTVTRRKVLIAGGPAFFYAYNNQAVLSIAPKGNTSPRGVIFGRFKDTYTVTRSVDNTYQLKLNSWLRADSLGTAQISLDVLNAKPE